MVSRRVTVRVFPWSSNALGSRLE